MGGHWDFVTNNDFTKYWFFRLSVVFLNVIYLSKFTRQRIFELTALATCL
jgi:hypothetical protein